MIKQNELELANTDPEVKPIKRKHFPFFLTFCKNLQLLVSLDKL